MATTAAPITTTLTMGEAINRALARGARPAASR